MFWRLQVYSALLQTNSRNQISNLFPYYCWRIDKFQQVGIICFALSVLHTYCGIQMLIQLHVYSCERIGVLKQRIISYCRISVEKCFVMRHYIKSHAKLKGITCNLGLLSSWWSQRIDSNWLEIDLKLILELIVLKRDAGVWNVSEFLPQGCFNFELDRK